MKKIAMLFAAVLLAFSLHVPAFANDGLTRGEFFQLVVNQLGEDAANITVEMPKDVPADSPYANAVKVLIAKEILNGYGNGEIGVNDAIQPEHASYILARIFGISDEVAVSELANTFGVSLGDGNVVDPAVAEEAVASFLSSDETATQLNAALNEVLLNIESYHLAGAIDMNIKLDEAFLQEMGDILGEIGNMSMDMEMDYHVEEGLRQVVTVNAGGFSTEMEQYIVPEGFFTSVMNPETGEVEWVNMTELLPFTFEELIQLQEESVFINQQFDDKYFYYKDLGTETIDGVEYKKIGTYGTIDSVFEVLNQLSGVMPGTELLAIPEDTPDMKMNFSGVIYVNEETLLPLKQQMTLTIQYGEVSEELPIEEISLSMDIAFSQFNEISGITVPEEALNAPSILDGIEITEEIVIEEEVTEEVTEVADEEEAASEEAAAEETAVEEETEA